MKLLSTLFFILISSITLLAQKKFAPLYTEWQYQGYSYECTGNPQKFRVENEFVFDDKDCSVIYAYLWDYNLGDWQATGDSLVVWEEESKVYFLEDTSFYLLYNFDLELNEVVEYYDPVNRGLFTSTFYEEGDEEPHLVACKVTGIDEIVAESGEVLKKYSVDDIYISEHCNYLNEIVENVGCFFNTFTGFGCPFITSGCFGGFVCYKNGTLELYSDEYDCDTFTSIDIESSNIVFSIYPNPFQSQLIIESIYPGEIEVQLYNALGKLAAQVVGEGTIHLEIANLPSGHYYVSIRNERGKLVTNQVVAKK
jgi:hypothetical protein